MEPAGTSDKISSGCLPPYRCLLAFRVEQAGTSDQVSSGCLPPYRYLLAFRVVPTGPSDTISAGCSPPYRYLLAFQVVQTGTSDKISSGSFPPNRCLLLSGWNICPAARLIRLASFLPFGNSSSQSGITRREDSFPNYIQKNKNPAETGFLFS